MWVVGLSLPMFPPTIFHLRAAAAVTPLSRSPSSFRLLQRLTGFCAARTDEYLKYSSSGSSHEVLSKIAPLSTSIAASRLQIRRLAEKTANLLYSAVLAVSHDLNGLSANNFVGLLHPTTDYGVHLVSCRPATFPPRTRQSPQAPDPSEFSPPGEVDTVTKPLLVCSPIVQPLS